MINKIITIIRAKLRDKESITDQWYHDRVSICNACPHNSKNIDPVSKNLRYYIFKYLNLNKDFCTICDCEIEAKASEEMEECPIKKWKQIN